YPGGPVTITAAFGGASGAAQLTVSGNSCLGHEPYIDHVDPPYALPGASGTITIIGANLAIGYPSVNLDGLGLGIGSVGAGSVSVYYFNLQYSLQPGQHTLHVATDCGTAQIGFALGDP